MPDVETSLTDKKNINKNYGENDDELTAFIHFFETAANVDPCWSR